MAKEFFGYFDSTTTDKREYDAAEFANLLRAVAQNGVTSHAGGLQVSAAGSMTTAVSAGGCVINGYLYTLSDDGGGTKRLTHPASAASDRCDRVVARLDLNSDERTLSIRLKTGVPGASAAPPALERTSMVYELSLARVLVRARATAIAAVDVTDERADEQVCGLAMPVWLNKAALDNRYSTAALVNAAVDSILAGKAGIYADYLNGDGLVRFWAAVKEKLDALQTAQGTNSQHLTELKKQVDGKATVRNDTIVLNPTEWSASAPYRQTVNVSGITAAMEPLADLVVSGTDTTAAAQVEAWSCVGRLVTGNGTITAYCYDRKPETVLTVKMKVVA
ncbi:MAG: hypothetical protein RR301_10285 [Clostridia bacterium]